MYDYEMLCCDWNKWNDCVIVMGSVDKTVRLWDIWNSSRELYILVGYDYVVCWVKCLLYVENVVYMCLYDMMVGMWDWKLFVLLLNCWGYYIEFVVGLDTLCLVEGLVVLCGWDEMVYVWNMVDGSLLLIVVMMCVF